jgi:hypothetical protein
MDMREARLQIADGVQSRFIVRVCADEEMVIVVPMAAVLCSTMPRMTACSCHRGTKMAICFSGAARSGVGEFDGWGTLPNLRCTQAQKQIASNARSSRPLTRMAMAAGTRQAATAASSVSHQDERTVVT